jgi:hypothetical protein
MLPKAIQNLQDICGKFLHLATSVACAGIAAMPLISACTNEKRMSKCLV